MTRIEGGYCPVARTERPLKFRGETETISGHTITVWRCEVCDAEIHEPTGPAPFDRHRRIDCRIECLDMGRDS